MRRKSSVLSVLVVVAGLVLLSAPTVWADVCVCDFDYDGNVYPSDLSVFLGEYGTTDCDPNGPAPVPKTGQTTQYATGDDGDLEKGVEWPNPRFTNNGDGTVTDNLTGLIWLRDANCIVTNYPGFDNDDPPGDGMVIWQHALDFVAGINSGTYPSCGAGNTDWRLPNIKELQSIIDYDVYLGGSEAMLPDGHPFNNVKYSASPLDAYWTSTTWITMYVEMTYIVDFCFGETNLANPDVSTHYVWMVRGGR
jgi:hypothetical protein